MEYLLPMIALGVAAIVVNKIAQRMKREDRSSHDADQTGSSGWMAGGASNRDRDDRHDERRDAENDRDTPDNDSGSDGGGFDGGGDGGSD